MADPRREPACRVGAAVSSGAARRLHAADLLLRDPDLIEEGVWPRACTWLIRLAVEHAIDDFWRARHPQVAAASRRAQLIALTRSVDAELGGRTTALWYALSRAAHHHAYELAPTAAELRSWHTEATTLTRELTLPIGRQPLEPSQ